MSKADIHLNRAEVRRLKLGREAAEFVLRRRLAERDEDYAAKHAPHVTVQWRRASDGYVYRFEQRGTCCGWGAR